MNMTATIPASSTQQAKPAGVHPRPALELQDASVVFGSGDTAVTALSPTNLRMDRGDFLALVGPSGCGKSTILKLVSNLIQPSSGLVLVGGKEAKAKELRIGMAFQNPTMLPWLTIEQNILMPLKIVAPFKHTYRKDKKGAFRDRVHDLLGQVGLKDFANHYPWQLSGGMLQRSNLCRALVHEPDLLLLDEPFGALDQFTREELWQIMQTLYLDRKPTVLLVTHDLREAGYLANRICVMSARPGRIISDEPVNIPQPRDIGMIYSPEFVEMTQGLRELIAQVRNA
ncbi:ABC transporter ATP-binding protein [Marivita cryptomonadis]|uniref:ABC transporter ATP-binding protein n=2 Tax=Roseobacteraceae TaxID=2854170 RepID=A0A9Q2NSD4_9RHOB|nr:ABC transporter ATP-binding protein [Marivita cryptomonadis]MBM2329674.1 ABC transporter ATP-binding protein [Marivita cryptomonadis]MBM2339262.1 ABC transporter ATP-binding protein [Marivita cryptomonadis]MBM2343920.1 ABC transporter ATP-binding protein [Marivita cryptomonadis]MBM2348598.1 ABC transporter ATP-binding protein [Marivita cryptomonadis]